jgi:hypothetical protein
MVTPIVEYNLSCQHFDPHEHFDTQLIYIVHLVGFFYSCVTMHGFMNVEFHVLDLSK